MLLGERNPRIRRNLGTGRLFRPPPHEAETVSRGIRLGQGIGGVGDLLCGIGRRLPAVRVKRYAKTVR